MLPQFLAWEHGFLRGRTMQERIDVPQYFSSFFQVVKTALSLILAT